MWLKKLFGFDSATMSVRTEVIAGVTTFLAMSYILAVNPDIFSALQSQGMATSAVFTATALAAIVGTLVMALYAKKPFALAPGIGLNAFFVYTVCLGMGHTWQFALTAVFLEGVLFIILTVTNVRNMLVAAIPQSMRYAIGAGIGLFIAFIGLKNAGIIVNNESTLVSLGTIFHGSALLGVIGLVITSALLILRIPGNLLLGIIITTVIGMLPVFDLGDGTVGALTTIHGVVQAPPSIAPIFCQFQWNEVFSLDMLIVMFTFFFVDMFDTIGTVIGLSSKNGCLDKDGNIEGGKKIFLADSIATTVGAVLGVNTTTTYVESAAGVAEGGRSGLTAFSTACCFAVSLLFAPFFLCIPSAAVASAMVLVGLMMVVPIRHLPFDDYSESVPAFITLVLTPLAYSISDGILLGLVSYVVINACAMKFKKISIAMWALAFIFVLRYLYL